MSRPGPIEAVARQTAVDPKRKLWTTEGSHSSLPLYHPSSYVVGQPIYRLAVTEGLRPEISAGAQTAGRSLLFVRSFLY